MLKRMPHIHKNIIYMGNSKFNGSVLSLPFHFCSAVISIQLEVGPIIIWLVVSRDACLEDTWVDVVGSQNMCGTIIEVSFMAVKYEDLGVNLASSTGPTEETHCLHPATPVHISRQLIVD